MTFDFRYPNITGATEREQVQQLKIYIHQLVDELKWALNSIENAQGNHIVDTPQKQNASGGNKAADFVVEQGTEGIWYYRKWNSGVAECWCRNNVDVNVNIAWGSALHYGVIPTINYPFKFTERPICQVTCEYGTDEVSLFVASCGTGTNTYATPVMLCRTDAKQVNCDVLYHAHGRWK